MGLAVSHWVMIRSSAYPRIREYAFICVANNKLTEVTHVTA